MKSKPVERENHHLQQAIICREPGEIASHYRKRTSEGSKPLKIENQYREQAMKGREPVQKANQYEKRTKI